MAHVMHPGSAHFSGTYIPTVAGWVQATASYGAAPFNSKPPPVPAGVNPQTWQTGQWRINPFFRPQPGITHGQPVWAPHPGWGSAVAQAQAHQAQSTYNPHKRIPNPGDATYWATKLSDNPLGLQNMHIKDPVPTAERHVKEQNGVPHTPWVWVPKELSTEETNRSAHNSSNPLSQASQPQVQQAEKALPPPPPSSSTHDHTRAQSASQSTYANPYAPSSQSRLSQQAHTPAPPTSASSAVPSYSAYHQQQHRTQEIRPPDRYTTSASSQQQQQQADTAQHSRQHSYGLARPAGESQSCRDYRTSSTSASSSASAASVARERERTSSIGHERILDCSNEAFSQSREMHLTFSPNIIRTPDHYSSPSNSRRASQDDDDDRTLSRTPAPHGNIYAPSHSTPSRPTPSRSNSMSAYRHSTTPSTGSTSGQATPSSSLGLLTFTEEPQALLSPLVVGSTPPTETKSSPGRDVSRSQSYPLVRNPNSSFGFTGESEREGKAYPRTPRPYENVRSRLEPVDQGYHHSPDRDRSVNTTPQPRTRSPPKRSPPTRTPPSQTSPSYNTRPSPEAGAHHARQISRSHTYPSIVSHGAAISPPVIPPPVIPSPVGSPPSNSMSTPPRYGSSSSQHSSSSSHAQGQQYPPNSRSSYSSSSYSRMSPTANSTRSRAASPLRHNPLPRPPAVSPYAESLTRGAGSSASAAAAAHQQSSYHNQSKRMVRRGYWNRRGDYLYVTDKDERFIVYAPRSLANPEELKQYPSATDGWLDHRGDFIKYDPKVPELLDSLPVHGEAPKRPYQHFVQYTEV
ncbi:hypothetical protein LXA43DRAFT_1001426 [Ganoderma leucocontextum]|nr:hypothetical protein LXA43DRAFT_1001426 [Ganoderma leucocontextum]